MSILEHLGEVKRRMFRVAIVFTLAMAVIIVLEYQYHYITDTLTGPAKELLDARGGDIIFLKVTEPWGVAARVSFLAACIVALPYALVEITLFLRPGLKPNERKYIYLLAPGAMMAFAVGSMFGYFILIPFFLEFLIGLGSEVAKPQISISLLIGQILAFVFWMGVIFQLPIVMFLLAKIGLISSASLSRKRRWIILGAFVMGAAITPTVDPITQLLVAGPIMLLFEIGLLLIRLAERGREPVPTTSPS
jgi:sec-independent protein translocase protein TatC